jgi:hypothetical protein
LISNLVETVKECMVHERETSPANCQQMLGRPKVKNCGAAKCPAVTKCLNFNA